jgi:hypothetical protein
MTDDRNRASKTSKPVRLLALAAGMLPLLLGAAACAESVEPRPTSPGAAEMQAPELPAAGQCLRPGATCRWDQQCCSGRCYVETGCQG